MVNANLPPKPWSFAEYLVYQAQFTDARLNTFHASLIFKQNASPLNSLIALEEEWERFHDLYLRYCAYNGWTPVLDYSCGDWTTGRRTLATALAERGAQIRVGYEDRKTYARGVSF